RVLRSPGGAWLRAAQGVVDDLATTLFPADCCVCKGPLLRAQDAAVCDTCLSRIPPQSMTLCASCGEALAPEAVRAVGHSHYAQLASLCPMCRMAAPEFERAVAYGVYED